MQFWQSLNDERSEELVPLARAAEELGFAGVFIADHLVGHQDTNSQYPYGYYEGDAGFVAETDFPEPFSAICAMAAVTSTLRFSTSVFIAPLRHPILLAKQLATASLISQDRVTLGAGVGWLREEFTALGVDFGTRGARLDEMIDVMRKLWTGEMVEHHGTHYNFDALKMLPAPRQPIPILCGGLHQRVLERAGKRCDGWLTPGNSTQEFEQIRNTIDAIRATAGRADSPFEYFVSPSDPGELEWYRALDDPRIRIQSRPLSFTLGREASLQERIDALAAYAKTVGMSRP
jgi:probable F420-dependent oxidoreductase